MSGTNRWLAGSIAGLLLLGVLGVAVTSGDSGSSVAEDSRPSRARAGTERAESSGRELATSASVTIRPDDPSRMPLTVADPAPSADVDATAVGEPAGAGATKAKSQGKSQAAGGDSSAGSGRPGDRANRPAAGTRKVEQSDTGGYFTYEDAKVTGRGSAQAPDDGLVSFTLSADVVDDHGRAVFKLVNTSDGDIAFPDRGMVVKISVTRPDRSVVVYEVPDPELTMLPPRGEVEGRLDFPITEDGQYSYVAEVLVEYR